MSEKTYHVSDTLLVVVVTAGRPYIRLERVDGGLILLELNTIRTLTKALNDGAALAAERSSWQRELRYIVSDTIVVIAVLARERPHLLVEYVGGGLVRIKLDEVGSLIRALKDASAFVAERSLWASE